MPEAACTFLPKVSHAATDGSGRVMSMRFVLHRCDSVSCKQVWQVLASVLHLSNMEFHTVDDAQGEVAAISDRQVSGTSGDVARATFGGTVIE